MKRQRSLLLALGLLVTASSVLTNATFAETDAEKKAALEKKFEQTLTNAALVGSFTVTGKQNKLTTERYVITKVTKVQEGFWLFQARIQYGRHDVTVPLLLEVKWAGDTPVIVVDKMKIPKMGTYSARVLIFNDQYVGMWDAGDHGGQMFGRIERADKDKDKDKEDRRGEAGKDKPAPGNSK